MSLQRTLEELGEEGRKLSASRLALLSDLCADEAESFLQAWTVMGSSRRRQVLGQMVEMAEDNPDFNFDCIFRLALGDPDEEVRVKAIEGLAECEDPSLVEPLVEQVQANGSPQVRSAAVVALGRFALLAELGKIRPKYGSRIINALIPLFRDQAQPLEVRRRAVEAIAPLSLPEVKKVITEAYLSPEPPMRSSAIYAMGRNCDDSWLNILTKELRNPSAEVRYEAAAACGDIGEERAVPHLIPLLADDDPQVQEMAVVALGKIGGTEAKLALRRCLQREEPRIRQTAQEAMAQLEAVEDPFAP